MIWGLFVLAGLVLLWLVNTTLKVWYHDDGW